MKNGYNTYKQINVCKKLTNSNKYNIILQQY